MAVEQARGGQQPRPGADAEQVRATGGPAGEPLAQRLFFPAGRGDYGRDHDHGGFGCRARVHVAERIVGHHGQRTREHRGRAGGHRVHEEFGRAGEDLIRPERIGDDRAAGAEYHRDGQAAPRHRPRRRPALRWGGAWRPRVGRPHRYQRPGGTGPRHRGTGQRCPAQAAGKAARQEENAIRAHLAPPHRASSAGRCPSSRTRRTCGVEPDRLDPPHEVLASEDLLRGGLRGDPRCKVHCPAEVVTPS